MISRSVLCRAAAVVCLGLVPARIVSAQDSMQLDLEFRNSLLRGSPQPEQAGRRRDADEAQEHIQGQIDVARRHPRYHRPKKV